MEHVVFFPAPDGAPVFRRVATLEDAVRLVEHLRNVEGVGEVAVHPLGAEVPLAFRPWYRVEVPAAAAEQPVAVEAPQAPEVAEVAAEPVGLAVEAPAEQVPAQVVVEQEAHEQGEPALEPVPVLAEASANGHSGDGVKSLGFFA